jgi:hypothetical protein
MNLEQITGYTCANKIKVLRNAYVSESDYKCMNCDSYELCDRYKPVSKTQIPIRRGVLATIR